MENDTLTELVSFEAFGLASAENSVQHQAQGHCKGLPVELQEIRSYCVQSRSNQVSILVSRSWRRILAVDRNPMLIVVLAYLRCMENRELPVQ